MSNELVESTRGKGGLFGLLWTFATGIIFWNILSFTLIDNFPNIISISNFCICMFFILIKYLLAWGRGQIFLVPRGFELNSMINIPVQQIENLIFSQRFNAAELEVISKDIGSGYRSIWGQLQLGNRIFAKHGKWKIRYQKTIQRERQR